ncbi:restriction endonuclease subunit S [Acinetobacter brisouii]|uniref:restriction endonuclease subunit S n=1 Tax=Acinetobacter brisouii TaxID=396323 RepID=UPI0005F8262B|nr:restriction endonuclease subunit S [Acinetobacter brisouii]KJV39737.1 hypothetical protein VH98_04445 [Acinetobacter brisouii]
MSTDLNMEYQEVKFGEIAKNISKRVEPSETTLEIYVGLEHLDPDSLKITRHGVPSDVAGQKLLVKKGQIIFGKRRAYQRKVAVADWDCICSAHAMVLEAIPEKILPEFLPFFMQSNQFMERAVDISEGSLSPTIKWKNLENQSFLMPNIDEQQKVIDRALALDKVRIVNNQLLNKKTEIINLLFNCESNSINKIYLGDICEIIRGASPRPKGDPRYYGGDIPRVMTADMNRDGKVVYPCIDFLTEEGAKKSRLLPQGSLIMICSGGVDTVGLPSFLGVDACIHDGIIGLSNLNKNICIPEYLYYYLKINQFNLNANATHGGVFVNLTTDILKKFVLNLPSVDIQKKLVKKANMIEQTFKMLEQKLKLIDSMYVNNLIN